MDPSTSHPGHRSAPVHDPDLAQRDPPERAAAEDVSLHQRLSVRDVPEERVDQPPLARAADRLPPRASRLLRMDARRRRQPRRHRARDAEPREREGLPCRSASTLPPLPPPAQRDDRPAVPAHRPVNAPDRHPCWVRSPRLPAAPALPMQKRHDLTPPRAQGALSYAVPRGERRHDVARAALPHRLGERRVEARDAPRRRHEARPILGPVVTTISLVAAGVGPPGFEPRSKAPKAPRIPNYPTDPSGKRTEPTDASP